MRKEKLLAIQRNSMRDSDVTHIATSARTINRLHHRLLSTDTFEHRVGADSPGQLLNLSNSGLPARGHDVGCTELTSKFLP